VAFGYPMGLVAKECRRFTEPLGKMHSTVMNVQKMARDGLEGTIKPIPSERMEWNASSPVHKFSKAATFLLDAVPL